MDLQEYTIKGYCGLFPRKYSVCRCCQIPNLVPEECMRHDWNWDGCKASFCLY